MMIDYDIGSIDDDDDYSDRYDDKDDNNGLLS